MRNTACVNYGGKLFVHLLESALHVACVVSNAGDNSCTNGFELQNHLFYLFKNCCCAHIARHNAAPVVLLSATGEKKAKVMLAICAVGPPIQ